MQQTTSLIRQVAPMALVVVGAIMGASAPATATPQADLNRDGAIDMADLQAMKAVFFQDAPHADLNGDGIVNFDDLALLNKAGALGGAHHAQDITRGGDTGGFGVSLLPNPVISAGVGDTFTVEVWFDGVGNPILGGGFILEYDPTVLDYLDSSFEYVLVDIAGQPCDLPTSQCIVLDPVIVDESNGIIEAAAGDFTGIGLLGQPVIVAQLQFSVIDNTPETLVDLSEGGAGGPFACLFDPVCTNLGLFGTTVLIGSDPFGRIDVDPSAVQFPVTDTDMTALQSVIVTNVGTGDLSLGTVAGGDAIDPPFFIDSDNCSSAVLVPEATCEIQLSFAPQSESAFADTFNIPSDAPLSPDVTVTVDGTGRSVSPDISLPASVQFNEVTTGGSEDITLAVSNLGSRDLVIGAIGDTDALVAPFSVDANACEFQTVFPGDSCDLIITFAPDMAGEFSDSFVVNSNDPDSPAAAVNVAGTGVLPAPQIAIAGEDPAPTRPGIPTTSSYAISNTGTDVLMLGNIAGDDPLDPPFNIALDTCSGVSLNPGEGCTVDVTFSPLVADTFNDSFDVPSNDAQMPLIVVDITGRATTVGLSIRAAAGVNVGICKNATTNERITVLAVDGLVDCEGAGMAIQSGDIVNVLVPAVALFNNMRAFVGGVETSTLLAICTNRTTGQTVNYLPGDGVVDCNQAGLNISAGDAIIITTRGTVL